MWCYFISVGLKRKKQQKPEQNESDRKEGHKSRRMYSH